MLELTYINAGTKQNSVWFLLENNDYQNKQKFDIN